MARRNPFSTRFVGPDAIPYLAPEPAVDAMVEALASGGRWAIVGPHGTGKTTLVAHLRRSLRARGLPTQLMRIHDGGLRRHREGGAGLRIIDGYEQLTALGRLAARRHRDLLVTSHRPPSGFSLLWTTEVDEALGRAIVARLVAGEVTSPIGPEAAPAALRRAKGNMRDALLELYLAHERLTRGETSRPS